MGREENPLQMEGSKEQRGSHASGQQDKGRSSNPKTTCSSSYGRGGQEGWEGLEGWGGQEGPPLADPLVEMRNGAPAAASILLS